MTVFYWVVKAIIGPFLRLIFRPWAKAPITCPVKARRSWPATTFRSPITSSRRCRCRARWCSWRSPSTSPAAASRACSARRSSAASARSRSTGPGGEASERALRTGLRVLAAGELLGIYPEGTRTPDGRLYRGKTGVARLALEARAPVIPTAMIGGFEFQPPGKLAPRLAIRPGVRFGKPLDFSRYYGLEQDRIVLRAMTDEIMYELMKLSGQEYVDEYAQRAKGRLTSARAANPSRPGARRHGWARQCPRRTTPRTRISGETLAGSSGESWPGAAAARLALTTPAFRLLDRAAPAGVRGFVPRTGG